MSRENKSNCNNSPPSQRRSFDFIMKQINQLTQHIALNQPLIIEWTSIIRHSRNKAALREAKENVKTLTETQRELVSARQELLDAYESFSGIVYKNYIFAVLNGSSQNLPKTDSPDKSSTLSRFTVFRPNKAGNNSDSTHVPGRCENTSKVNSYV